MSQRLKLYSSPISPFSMRVVMQARAKGLELDLLDPPGGLGSAQYCAIAPMGKVPVLEYDGIRLPESEAICEFLEDTFPAPALRPQDPMERARVRLLSRILDTYVMNPMIPLFQQMDPAKRNFTIVGEACKSVQRGLDWLEAYITPGPYAAFDRLTLADCTAVPILYLVEKVLPMFGIPGAITARKKINGYWSSIKNDPLAVHALAGMKAVLG